MNKKETNLCKKCHNKKDCYIRAKKLIACSDFLREPEFIIL